MYDQTGPMEQAANMVRCVGEAGMQIGEGTCEKSAIEQSIDRLAKVIAMAAENTESIGKRLEPVSCPVPVSDKNVKNGPVGTASHIELRINNLSSAVERIANSLGYMRDGLRI